MRKHESLTLLLYIVGRILGPINGEVLIQTVKSNMPKKHAFRANVNNFRTNIFKLSPSKDSEKITNQPDFIS